MSSLGLQPDAVAASNAPLTLDDFDFDATLDPSLLNSYEFSSSQISRMQSIEDASKRGDLAAVKEALGTLSYIPQGPSNLCTGRALLLAIEHQHRDIVACLLSAGVQPSSYEVKRATLIKNTPILQLLFEEGWNINKEFGWDDPPALAYAVEDVELTAWFLAHGADPNASCLMDKTPLSAAVQYGSFAVVQMMFSNGGKIDRGQLLHAAVWRRIDDRKVIMEYLIQQGAQVNYIMYQDRPETYLMREAFGLGTPLHAAAAIGDEEIVRVLVDHGARIDIKDSCGFLASQRAGANGYSAIAHYLQRQASLGP